MVESLLSLVEISTAIVIVAAIFGELLSRAIVSLARRGGAHGATIRAIRDWLRTLWIAVAIAAVIFGSGVANQLTILTVGGIATIVISLSLQSLFSNIISGLYLLRDGAIRIGDVVEFGSVKGRVARIALRNAWLITETGEVAIVGNSTLAGGPLINHTSGPRLARELTD